MSGPLGRDAPYLPACALNFAPAPLEAGRDGDRPVEAPRVDLAELERREGLEEARAVVGAGGVGELEHLLGELAVELGARVREVRLDVDELLQVVELAVHLEDHDHFDKKKAN